MQTSKYLFAAGLLAAVILPLHVQGGPDNDEQAKMREALRRAMEQPGASKSQPVAPAPATPVAPQAEQPVTAAPAQHPVTPVAPPPTPTVVVETPQAFENVPPSDPESMARAREAMRQKLQELQAKPAPAPAVAPEPTKPVVAVTPPPAAPKPAPAPQPAPAPAVKPAPAPVVTATSTYKPIEAPASPFSAAKQAKLNELLARYRADAITAQEYHAQRAAIIAEP